MARVYWICLLCLVNLAALGAEDAYSRQLMRDQASLLILAEPSLEIELSPLLRNFDTDTKSLEQDYLRLKSAWHQLGMQSNPGYLDRSGNTIDNSSETAEWAHHQAAAPDLNSRLIALEPNDRFLNTMNRLRHLLWLAEQPWPPIVLNGLLRPGDSHTEVAAIAKRLWLLGDMEVESGYALSRYDDELAQGVKAFQHRHGLKQDAVIGPKTLYWLNLAPETRAARLAKDYLVQSRERQTLPSTYVLVNIPAFDLELVDDGEPLMHSRVIVGKPSRKTPFIQSEISAVVVNPSWRVPRRLMRLDVLPKVRKDGSYLSRKGFIVWSREGEEVKETDDFFQSAAAGKFPYLLEQRPGPDNALGRFKLHFANDDNVYLHDTPDKHLFDEPMRALSSGCVRVEKINELSAWLANGRLADPRRWQQTLQTPQTTRWFTLKERLPVHFVYWTSWVDAEGKAQFREDIYGFAQNNQILAAK